MHLCYKYVNRNFIESKTMGVLWVTLALVGSFFILMSVRLIFIKDGEFKGTCASQSPFLRNEGTTCGYCGKEVGSCDNEKNSSNKLGESEVDKVLSKY